MNTAGFPFKLACLALCPGDAVAGGCLQRNMPGSAEGEAKSPCGCSAAAKDSASVDGDCIKIVLGLGETTPWTGSRDVALKTGGSDAKTYVFDYVMGDWSLKRPNGVEERKERYIADERAAFLSKSVFSPSGGTNALRTVTTFYPVGGPASVPAETEWRRSEVRSLFIMQDGAIWLLQTNIVSCSDSTIAPLVTSSSRQLTGLTAALPSRSRSTDVRGNVTENERLFSSSLVASRQAVPYATNKPLSISRYGMDVMDVSVSAVTNTYAYDSLGRQIAHTDGRGNTTRTEYNALVQRSASIDALGNRTTYAYDQFGNLAAVTNPLGNAIVYEYDLRGRKTYEGGATYPVRYTYDMFGNKTTMMTYRNESLGPDSGDVTTWLYDEASNCMTNKVYADGKGPRYSYTPDGRLSRRTWARGIETDYAYDGWGNLTNAVYSDDTPPLAYSYADSGKLASAILSDGTFYAYGYDAWLLNTNESVHVDSSDFAVERTHDGFRRALGTSVVVTNVRHAAKVRLYDAENRVCGYALTNAAGRGVSVSFAYDGSYVTNVSYALQGGSVFAARFSREAARKELVTRRDYLFGGQQAYWYSTDFDLIGRPTNATDSVSLVREWLYNNRSELTAATVGTNLYGYSYDTIGNRLWYAANVATNEYAANALNQYTSVDGSAPDAPQTTFVYDADGNMTRDGRFSYSYDAENRLRSVTARSATNGALRVLNAYDHRNRRIRKTLQQLHLSVAQPPALPVEIREWQTLETHTFVWDGNNIILEKVDFADGTTRTFEYFWGMDKSGTEQGAGGVGGLLAVSMDGVFYIPCYDHNGNIVLYVSETGGIAAQYTYDPYGNIIDSSGPLADVFSFGFSTQYHDRETGMVGYKRRFYRPDLGRWLNRDPIGEDGGHNLMSFAMNNPATRFDTDGCFVLPIMVIPDPTPPPPPEPSPSITDHIGNSTDPLGEERWFENNYAGWLAEARRRFTAEINAGVDCSSTTFNGPSGRINIYPSDDRGGSTSKQTPGGNEQEYGDAGQSDWSADKVLGSFSIDYVTPVTITYTNGTKGKRAYTWTTTMYVEDVLGTQEGDRIRYIPGVASITPSRRVRRASWTLSGSGECCVKK